MITHALLTHRHSLIGWSAPGPVRAVLAGVAQIFFSPRALVGAGLLAAVAIASPLTAALLLLGSAVQTAAGWLLRQRDLVPAGLMGYNGALVGAVGAVALGPNALAVGFTIVGAFSCAPLHVVAARVFATRLLRPLRLPVLTIPFCTVAGAQITLLSDHVSFPAVQEVHDLMPGLAIGFFKGISTVMLTDSALTGLLLLGIVAAGSRWVAAFAALGSALAVVWMLLTTGTAALGSTGIPGFSPVLAAIAVGMILWPERTLPVRVIGAVCAAITALVLHPIVAATPIPVFTWPFITGTITVLTVDGLTRALRPTRPV